MPANIQTRKHFPAGRNALIATAMTFAFRAALPGFVSGYLPKTGALGLSLMGGAGMFSTSLIIPVMGRWFMWSKQNVLLTGWTQFSLMGGRFSNFLRMSIMPGILLLVFVIIHVRKKQEQSISQSFCNTIV